MLTTLARWAFRLWLLLLLVGTVWHDRGSPATDPVVPVLFAVTALLYVGYLSLPRRTDWH